MADDKKQMDPLFIWGTALGMVIGFALLVWFALGDRISSGTRWIRVAELWVIGLFTDKYEPLRLQLIALPYGQISLDQFLAMNIIVVGLMKYPIAAIIFVFCWRTYTGINNKNPFTRKFDLEGLTKEHALAFPVIRPATKFNPLKENHRKPGDPVPARLPPFAEALSPEEWVSYSDIPLTDNLPDRDAARRAFLPQLGKRWQGVAALPPYAQALFAAFAMKGGGQRIESDEFLATLSTLWEPDRGLVLTAEVKEKIKAAIADPKQGRVLEKIAAQHAFVTCSLLRCLQFAREQGGVLAPAQFLWLRAVDRTLWYPLNNLGRGAVHAEAAGAITHYRAERSANKPIPNPQLDPAVDGLLVYIQADPSIVYPAKDYNKK
jgi:intracellular multiplication protein IcmP